MNNTLTDYSACIQACNSCADACDYCAASCLSEGGGQDMVDCISADIDCAAICRVTAGFMARGSEHAVRLAAICAEICARCEDECSSFESQHCQYCAEACNRCVEECSAISRDAGLTDGEYS